MQIYCCKYKCPSKIEMLCKLKIIKSILVTSQRSGPNEEESYIMSSLNLDLFFASFANIFVLILYFEK